MGNKFFQFFFPCRLLPRHPPYLIMLSASPSSFFKESSHIGIGAIIENINKYSIRMAIEHGSTVSESSTKISKFHAPTDSEYKFHKARIENWPPIEFKLGFLWLRIRRYNHRLRTRWMGVPGTQSSTIETVQVFPNPTPGIK